MTSNDSTRVTLPLPTGTRLCDSNGIGVPGATVDTTGVTFTVPAGTHTYLLTPPTG